MGLHRMWRIFCAPMTGFNPKIIEQAIATYNVAEMTSVIDGCKIALTLEAIAEALKVPMETEQKGQSIDKEDVKAIRRVNYTNQGWAIGAMEHRLVYQFICEFVSMKGNHSYISEKHLKMFYGKLAHKHAINVAQEICMITKVQMEKAAKGEMVKCGCIW